MKSGLSLIFFSFTFSGPLAHAQLTSLNPSSSPYTNPENLFALPLFPSNVAQYAADFTGLYFASNLNVPSVITDPPPWPLGPTSAVPLTGADLIAFTPFTTFNPLGGSVKVIFLGETAGASNDFGYTLYNTGGPLPTHLTTHTSLITNIETTETPNIFSGWETVFNYGPGQSVDLWLNGRGFPWSEGGFFYFLGSGNHLSGGELEARMRWNIRDVTTTYFDSGGNIVTGELPTLVMGLEDLRFSVADNDFNDIVVAVQFLPIQLTEIPEPGTFGPLGAAGLLGWGLVGCRRRLRV